MAAVWVAPSTGLIVRLGPVPGQRAAGGFVLDRLHGRFRGLRRLVSQGPAQVALLGDQRGKEHLFANDVDDPGSLQRLVHVVLNPSQAQVDAAIGELTGQLSQAIGCGYVDLDVGLDVEHEPPQRGVRVGLVLYGYELAYRSRRSSMLAKNSGAS